MQKTDPLARWSTSGQVHRTLPEIPVQRSVYLGTIAAALPVAVAVVITGACSADHSLTSPSGNGAVPALASPADDAVVVSLRPTLAVYNVSNAAEQPTYDFQVADMPALLSDTGTGLIAFASGVSQGMGGQTKFVLDRDLRFDTRYYWRARAVQAGVPGPWSTTFRFKTDSAPNNPPVIQSLTPSSDRAEVNGEIEVTAVVLDQETSVSQLIYQWTASTGVISGNGPTAGWHAPASGAPVTAALTLTVIERYTVSDPDGTPQSRENRATASVSVHVNDSPKEIRALALTFLDDFVHSDRSPAYCVRNFSDSCSGKQDELSDIESNRATDTIDPSLSSYSIESITYNTPGDVPAQSTFATILAPCRFYATKKATGQSGYATGTCELTSVYENWKWYLCDSHFQPSPESMASPIARSFRF